MDNIIGQRIREVRKAAQLTQKELAKKTGLSYVQVSRYETGSQEPHARHLKLIADAVGCEAGYLDGTLDCATRVTTDIYNEIPLTGEAIDLLRKLNEECKYFEDCGCKTSDSHLTASIINEIIIGLLSTYDDEGARPWITELVSHLKDAHSEIIEGNPMIEEFDELPPGGYKSAIWRRMACENEIGLLFKRILSIYARRCAKEEVKEANNGEER